MTQYIKRAVVALMVTVCSQGHTLDARDSDVDQACEIVGEIGVAVLCDPATEFVIIGRVGHPAAIVVALTAREMACSPAGQELTKRGLTAGCSWTVKRLGGTITFTIKEGNRDRKKLAAIWQCIDEGRCVHWLKVNLR
jgi:hypothetical protein